MESRQQQWQQELIRQRRLCVVVLCGILSAASAHCQTQDRAQEISAGTNTPSLCRFAVALPEMDGPVTLGIFSPDGKLTRLLYRDTATDSIPAGLNGLLVTWDGKDDSGLPVPPGKYHARGLVHGKLMASALPYSSSKPDWHDSRLQGTNDPSLASLLPFMLTPFSTNQITVTAAQDALLETRPQLTVSAFLTGEEIVVTAAGLPIFSIPIEPYLPPKGEPTITLWHGNRPGTAELNLISTGRKTSYLLSGLDQLVPLDAGALPMPQEIFIPDSASSDTGTPRP